MPDRVLSNILKIYNPGGKTHMGHGEAIYLTFNGWLSLTSSMT